MKHTILLTAFFLFQSMVASAQNKTPIRFMEIPWGSTVDAVRKVVDSIEGISFLEQNWGKDDNDDDDTSVIVLKYTSGEYAGYTVDSWYFLFYHNKLFHAVVKYNLEGAEAIKRWEKLVSFLQSKFGKPKRGQFAFLSQMRQHIPDQELWDKHLSSERYLLADWEQKINKHEIFLSCTTGDKDFGVYINFGDITVSQERDQADKTKRLKGM